MSKILLFWQCNTIMLVELFFIMMDGMVLGELYHAGGTFSCWLNIMIFQGRYRAGEMLSAGGTFSWWPLRTLRNAIMVEYYQGGGWHADGFFSRRWNIIMLMLNLFKITKPFRDMLMNYLSSGVLQTLPSVEYYISSTDTFNIMQFQAHRLITYIFHIFSYHSIVDVRMVVDNTILKHQNTRHHDRRWTTTECQHPPFWKRPGQPLITSLWMGTKWNKNPFDGVVFNGKSWLIDIQLDKPVGRCQLIVFGWNQESE